MSGAIKRDVRMYIRRYTSPNENFEYGTAFWCTINIFPSKRQQKCTLLRLYVQRLPAAYIHLSTNEKRSYIMTSGFQQYIAGYTVTNLWRYPIRRRVAFASALEWLLDSQPPVLPQKGQAKNSLIIVSLNFSLPAVYITRWWSPRERQHLSMDLPPVSSSIPGHLV